MAACQGDTTFDKDVWLRNSDMSDTSNPRARMVADVMAHHLHVGLTRDSVLALLGPPYSENIELVLPENVTLPDSLSLQNSQTTEKLYDSQNAEAQREGINAFYKQHGRPQTVLRYPVGWSTIDPNFLVICLTRTGKVASYYIAQG